MADLSWAREAGAAGGARYARPTPLVDAMFDGHVNDFWRRLSVAFQETVEAYNTAGQFRMSPSSPRMSTSSPNGLDRATRQIVLITKDADGEPVTDRLGCAFVDGDLTLRHTGQIENGYQLAKRLLKTHHPEVSVTR
jgi:hypothetical protein